MIVLLEDAYDAPVHLRGVLQRRHLVDGERRRTVYELELSDPEAVVDLLLAPPGGATTWAWHVESSYLPTEAGEDCRASPSSFRCLLIGRRPL